MIGSCTITTARLKPAGTPPGPIRGPGADRLHPDYARWLAALHEEQVQILVVARANPAEGRHNIADAEEFPIEPHLGRCAPGSLHPLYGVAERGSPDAYLSRPGGRRSRRVGSGWIWIPERSRKLFSRIVDGSRLTSHY